MMIDIPENFATLNQDMKCICGKLETMEHLYYCEILSSEKTDTEYKNIYNRNIHEQIKVLRNFENKLEIKKQTEKLLPA